MGEYSGELRTEIESNGIRFISAEVIVPGKDGEEGTNGVNSANEQLGASGVLRPSSSSNSTL